MSVFEKRIDFELSTQSINNAIRELNKFRKQLRSWMDALMRKLVEDGVVVCKMNVMHMNAVYTGALEDSIQGIFFAEEKMGIIYTDVPYAIFVEYGTGIVGEGTNASPLPPGYKHDYHNHGNKGWWYFLETDGVNQFRWTKGMVARPYMYETLRWLEENAEQIAGSISMQ